MINYSDIECIIPFKLSSHDRYENLTTVLKYFKTFFPQIKITIVEQDIFNKVRFDNVLFIKSDKPFNKSWILNCAAKKSDKKYLLFWDADMIVEPKYVVMAIDEFDGYDVIKPYKTDCVLDLFPRSTNEFREKFDFSYFKQASPRPGCPYCGGIFGVSKEKMMEIGGFIEEFVLWGAEDTAISIKIDKFTNYTETNNNGYHMYHSRNIYDRAYHPIYNKNVEILENYRKMNKEELWQECIKQRETMGIYV